MPYDGSFYPAGKKAGKITLLHLGVSNNFSKELVFDKKNMLAVIVPQLRKDGMYYEVNIKGYPRFYMRWSELGRYDVVDEDHGLPYQLILAVSDVIESKRGRR